MATTGRARIRYSYAEYAGLPPDGRRWELIDGELEVNPAPVTRHQTVSRRLQFELMRQLEETELALIFDAPTDVILSDHDVVQPDLAIVSYSRRQVITQRGIEGPPDIVVEILSTSTRVMDRRVKSVTYARFGVPEYWIVDPDLGLIELYRLAEDGTYGAPARFDRASMLTTPSFAELSVSLARVFRE
jgi:Uma2 family endonuclease